MPLPPEIAENLRLPLISAPMFLVSGPDLVIASCRSGVIGSFPTANCRTLDELDGWLGKIVTETSNAAPFAPNLIVHKSNLRLMEDTALVAKHQAPLVIASVGSPAPIIKAIHEYGGRVFADIASMRHAKKAIAAGVDIFCDHEALAAVPNAVGMGLLPSPLLDTALFRLVSQQIKLGVYDPHDGRNPYDAYGEDLLD